MKKPLFPHAYKMYRLYWDTLMKQMTLEEGVSLGMKELKEQGVYVGICTNMTAEIQYQKIEKLGITRWIDGVVTSEEAGVEKPEDCVFIGDSLRHDIEGAKQAGMQVIWYHKAELSEEEQQKAAQENIPVMRQFSQCIELLQSYVQRERGQKRCLED